jgi:hypothetical protein
MKRLTAAVQSESAPLVQVVSKAHFPTASRKVAFGKMALLPIGRGTGFPRKGPRKREALDRLGVELLAELFQQCKIASGESPPKAAIILRSNP